MSMLSSSTRATVLVWPGAGATLLAIFVGIGLSAVWMPLAPLILLAGIWIGIRGRHLPGDILIVIIAGNAILSWGFANLGLRAGGSPIPLTAILLLPLVSIAVLELRSLRQLGWVSFAICAKRRLDIHLFCVLTSMVGGR